MTIKIENLTKEFDGLVAVDHVNLEIERGELFGLLGPNGAGKTTLVHMLSTVLPPTEGKVEVEGHNVRSDPESVRKSIGIVFQDPSLDERLTGFENLDFHGRMYGIPKSERFERAGNLLEMVDLCEWADTLVKEYSGGMRRRLELARGFLHDPKVLFLDEPTLGLDPQTRRRIWKYIQGLNEDKGVTMILTTHNMEEADYLCGRVGIIDRGEIITLGSPEELKSNLEGDILTLKISGSGDVVGVFQELENVEEAEMLNGSLQLRVRDGEEVIPNLLKIAEENDVRVESVSLRKPTLGDVFIDYTGRKLREEKAGAKERMRMRRKAVGR